MNASLDQCVGAEAALHLFHAISAASPGDELRSRG